MGCEAAIASEHYLYIPTETWIRIAMIHLMVRRLAART